MRTLKIRNILFFLMFFTSVSNMKAQNVEKINWINFNQLNDSLKVKPKKVFVDFYADWCKVCKEMDRTTFKNPGVIKELNQNYYAVKMDVESGDKIIFGDQIFINKRMKKVNPVHELALILASRKDHVFSLPAYILFDENFTANARFFQFLHSNALLEILRKKDRSSIRN